MNTQNFTTTILVDRTPQETFDAINDVRGWWSGEIEGRTDALGAEFTYSYKTVHRTTQKITELVPGKKVVWHVTASQINFVRDKSEWDGTDIVFEIAKKGDRTEVRFTHVGLVPSIECYDGCSGAWGFYINESLREFITKGKGQPNPDERPSLAKGRDERRAHDAQR
ncbi:MAG TPA: SRPBCC domain-containing protein [Polyangiaceae bacterium]|nr:SRPBCC domain-containing protein [Polyangiaceae bacterium]